MQCVLLQDLQHDNDCMNEQEKDAAYDHKGSKKAYLDEMIKKIGERGITSILVESGGDLFYSFVKKNLYDTISYFVAPKYLESEGNFEFQNTSIKKFGDDTLIEFSK